MTVEQERWICKKVGKLREVADRKWPLSGQDWEALILSVKRIYEKSGRNQGVREALFDFLDELNERDMKERLE